MCLTVFLAVCLCVLVCLCVSVCASDIGGTWPALVRFCCRSISVFCFSIFTAVVFFVILLHWRSRTEHFSVVIMMFKVVRTSSSLRITDRSFRYASPRYASPCLWNQLPSSLRQPHFSPSVSGIPVHAPTTSSHSVNSPLSPSITSSLFHSRLKTYLFHKSFSP